MQQFDLQGHIKFLVNNIDYIEKLVHFCKTKADVIVSLTDQKVLGIIRGAEMELYQIKRIINNLKNLYESNLKEIRKHQRIYPYKRIWISNFETDKVRIEGELHVLNISLSGCFVHIPYKTDDIHLEEQVKMDIHCDINNGHELTTHIQGTVKHKSPFLSKNGIGIQFHSDADSVIQKIVNMTS